MTQRVLPEHTRSRSFPAKIRLAESEDRAKSLRERAASSTSKSAMRVAEQALRRDKSTLPSNRIFLPTALPRGVSPFTLSRWGTNAINFGKCHGRRAIHAPAITTTTYWRLSSRLSSREDRQLRLRSLRKDDYFTWSYTMRRDRCNSRSAGSRETNCIAAQPENESSSDY